MKRNGDYAGYCWSSWKAADSDNVLSVSIWTDFSITKNKNFLVVVPSVLNDQDGNVRICYAFWKISEEHHLNFSRLLASYLMINYPFHEIERVHNALATIDNLYKAHLSPLKSCILNQLKQMSFADPGLPKIF